MITSFVKLPEFAHIGSTVISGQHYGGIYESDLLTDIEHLQISGRNICIQSGMNKYKMRFMDYGHNRIYDIVLISPDDIILDQFHQPNLSAEIFPLYAREYLLAGAQTALQSNCILNVLGINRLFERLCLGPVATLVDAFRHIVEMTGINEISHIPSRILDKMYDERLATLAPLPPNTGSEIIMGNGEQARYFLETLVDSACVLKGYLCPMMYHIFESRNLADILPLIDPAHTFNPIEIMIREASPSFNGFFDWIHKNDDEEYPRYVSADRNGELINLLYYSSMMDASDFIVECNAPGIQSKTGKLFDPLTLQRSPAMHYNKLAKLGDTVREIVNLGFNWAQDSSCTGTGSYLEDFWIYDNQNELIAYIDLVWWILANGGGLLNSQSVYI